MTDPAPVQDDGQLRIDKWLWYARFFKTRSLAQKLCAGRNVRINKEIVSKSSAMVKIGDVLTFPQARRIRVVRILALASRRGPAPEAMALYEDLAPVDKDAGDKEKSGVTARAGSRPTKRDRRRMEQFKIGP